MLASVTVPDAPTATPPAVIVILTVLPVGSPTKSSAQVATPGAKLPQLWNVSVPGSSAAQLGDVHANFTVVVPNNVAATGAVFGGTVFELVLVILTSSEI